MLAQFCELPVYQSLYTTLSLYLVVSFCRCCCAGAKIWKSRWVVLKKGYMSYWENEAARTKRVSRPLACNLSVL